MRYHPHTEEDVRAMLDAVGAKSLDDLFRSIPEPLRLRRPLDVPPALDEIALFAEFRRLAAKNDVAHPPFAGAGCYPHHVPPAVEYLVESIAHENTTFAPDVPQWEPGEPPESAR